MRPHNHSAHHAAYYQTRRLSGTFELTELCQNKPQHYPYALVSTASFQDNGRFDIVFAYPQQSLMLDHAFRVHDKAGQAAKPETGFLDGFHDWYQTAQLPIPTDTGTDTDCEIPFTGGWFIYLSYELAQEIEPSLNLPEVDADVPVALAVRCPAAIVYDRVKKQMIAVAENEYVHLLDEIEKDAHQQQEQHQQAVTQTEGQPIAATDLHEAASAPYLKQVDKIKRYIRDGDIFQANLSRLWNVDIDKDVTDNDIFTRLSRSNPGSFACLIKLDKASIISSSPERLVRVTNGKIETRPIAGTRPRSSQSDTDEALANELMSHPKEQAEHIMLIDLERNDLGRVCQSGSVKVDELMTLESYQHVHHIVSNVSGRLRKGVSPAQVIRAVFPGGTITGCPKVHCMEILAEMEQQARGAYTGSVGYVNRNGNMDLNILIRTMVRKANSISFRAGGGIVADSRASHELEETRAKARGLLNVFKQEKPSCKA